MAKLKKILAAVLAASLLYGFSVSVASFATEYDMNKEDYIEEVEGDRKTLCVTVRNSKVAEANNIIYDKAEETDMDEVYYHLDVKEDSFSIHAMFANTAIVYIPETFLGKSVVVNKDFRGFSLA